MREEIEIMEESRTDYRAALSWLRATTVDPDKLGQIEKFRRVQAEVKQSKERFDIMKGAIQVKNGILKFFNQFYLKRLKSISYESRAPPYFQMQWVHYINTRKRWRVKWRFYLMKRLMV